MSAGRDMPRRRVLRCCWPPASALAVQPDEILPDPALEARARRHLGRPALPRLPEPVDRRQRRAARARLALAGARAPQGRRQRRPGGTIRRGSLRRVRAAAAAVSRRTLLLWLAPLLALLLTAIAMPRARCLRRAPGRSGALRFSRRGREAARAVGRERGKSALRRDSSAAEPACSLRGESSGDDAAFRRERLQQRPGREPRDRHGGGTLEPSIAARVPARSGRRGAVVDPPGCQPRLQLADVAAVGQRVGAFKASSAAAKASEFTPVLATSSDLKRCTTSPLSMITFDCT